MLRSFHVVAFTHKNLQVSEVGKLHIDTGNQQDRLTTLKENLHLDELMFLSTCNRVEFLFTTYKAINTQFLTNFIQTLYPHFSNHDVKLFVDNALVYNQMGAIEHVLQVASSIDSMIVGEREIITQVRNAFELSKKLNLTGDFIRLVIRHTIETAKRVYTETSIAQKPVSVVALAYHTLRDLNIPLDARFIIVGAGVTNANMSKFLKKHGFKNFVVFNRTFEKAQKLAEDLKGEALPLHELANYKKGFDVIITCTGSEGAIITEEIYNNLLQRESSRKVVIDIAIPQDLDEKIVEKYAVKHISVNYLQQISDQNLKARSNEITHVEEIIKEALFIFEHLNKTRSVERAMQEVPLLVKEIKSTAVNHVFKNEMNSLNDESKEVLEKIIDYMEKKYISVPMKLAKEIMLNKEI